jgi:signal transduction histidine kinase
MNTPENVNASIVLRPEDLKAVYAISLAIAQSENINTAMDLIVKHTRPILIFDNLILYIPKDKEELNPTYAQVIGRGKYAEGEIEWGGTLANQAYRSKQTTLLQEKLEGWENNRLLWREFLALPLMAAEEVLGVLVFGRFGGPPYTPDQIRLAEFIAAQISQLVENQHLVERVAKLEAEHRLQKLQDEFITTISHELRTPIGFIKGYATTLLREEITWDENSRQEFLNIIVEEADRLEELVDGMLDSSRLKAGTLVMNQRPIRLDVLLNEAVYRNITRYSSLKIHLQNICEVEVMADPSRITQVFENLLRNAKNYAPGSDVYISLEDLGESCVITIEDHGPGIEKHHLEHLFERFYRVQESGEVPLGTGLGLYICQQIIQTHGGDITVDSEVGRGTRFTITLPCKRERHNTLTVEEGIES